MESIREAMVTALQHHRAGRLQEAERIYREIIRVQPGHADALHSLGVVACHTNRLESAIKLFRSAIEINGNSGEFHDNLGGAYYAAGKFGEALASFKRALQLDPNNAKFHYDLGSAHKAMGNHDAARASFCRAVELKSDYVEALHNLGTMLRSLGRCDEAIVTLRRALELRPNYALGQQSLGNALHESGEFDEAISCFRDALQLKPNDAGLHNNLGTALKAQGRLSEAISCLQKAVSLKPDLAEAHENLGNCYALANEADEAVACFKRKLDLQPGDLLSLIALSRAEEQRGETAEALACLKRARKIEPEYPQWDLRIATLFPLVFETTDEMQQYRDRLLLAAEQAPAPNRLLPLKDLHRWAFGPPFTLLNHGANNRPVKEAFARAFQPYFPVAARPKPNNALPRIGFVITSFHEGVFARLVGGILENLPPKKFELVVVCSATGAETISARIQSDSIRILVVPRQFHQMVEIIRAAQFDILYHWEVGTDVHNYFLPFLQLAPIQLTSWGTQDTSGIVQMDYYLSSELLETEESDKYYSERLGRAKTLLSYQHRHPLAAAAKTREAFGFSTDQQLYVCAQRPSKVHPDFDILLANILRRDPLGVVALTENGYTYVAQKLRERFARRIPDVADRICFVPKQDYGDYLGLLAAADVLLDALHYAGMNTTYDGLSLNQPIVTLPGPFQVSRFTFGCYRKMGVTDCVASDSESYVDIAVRLATDSEYRAHVRSRIQDANHVLFEDMDAVHEHERVFHELFEEGRTR